MAAKEIASEPTRSGNAMRLVNLVGAGTQRLSAHVLARLSIESRQHFIDRTTNDFGIIVLDEHSAAFGKISTRMAP